MIYIERSVNELADEFRERVEILLEEVLPGTNPSSETLARWISEEFGKLLVEEGESDDALEESDLPPLAGDEDLSFEPDEPATPSVVR